MEQDQFAGRMSFYDHLDELRVRLVRSLYVFFGGFLACYFVSEPILKVLRKPLFDALPPDQRKLYFTSLFENFLTHLKISGYASLFFLSPFFFYQLWAFIAPGLYPRERKLVLPFIAAATGFFLGGACFAYFVLFPIGFKYFIHYGAPTDFPLFTIDAYYGLVLKLMLLFGLAFELPVLLVLLGFLGILHSSQLKSHRRTAIVGISAVSALVAPPDAMSMILLAVPLILMFEGSIRIIQWLEFRRAKAALNDLPTELREPRI